MMNVSISSLQAAAGRFLTTGGPMAWESESRQRHEALVRAFQAKQLDPEGLQAALAAERSARPVAPKSKAIGLIELTGPLMPGESIFSLLGLGTSVRTFLRDLTVASLNPTVKSIAIAVDSPGGSIGMIPEAAAALRLARTRKPIVVAVTGLNASAAYWVTSGATSIEATPSARVGAIGVITQRASIVKLLEREGIDLEIFSAGKFKAEGHEATAVSAAERQALQAQVDTAYRSFVDDVAAGRHTATTLVRSGFGEGRLVTAPEAARLGMIDRVATIDATLERIVSTPAEFAAAFTQRVEGQRQALQQYRADQARSEIADHRRALVAAARRSH